MNTLLKLPILGFILLLAACSSGNKTYIANIQSLQDSLQKNKQNLSFDCTPFDARIKEIEENLMKLKTDLRDTLTLEEGNAFDKYKGIMKIYMRNTGLYNSCLKDQESLEKQLQDLLADEKAGKLTDEEFNNYFATEKQDVLNLIEQSSQIKTSIYAVEPEFRRLSEIVYTKLETLKN
jgi:hypothetical protein